MPWAAGSYSKGNNGTGGWVGDASLGIGIEAGRHDTQDNDFATGINQCINKDGSNAFTGNPNLGGFIPTNIAAGTAAAPAICAGGDVNTGVFGPAADTWAVATNGAERVRVDSTGRVGIGTTSPGFTVDIQSTSSNIISNRFSADTNPPQIVFRKSRGASVGTNTIVAANDSIGGIYFQGANGTGYTDAAGILGEVDGTPGASNDMPGRLLFFTTPDGSGTTTERMRIDSAGNVGIGVTPTTRLHVSGAQVVSQIVQTAASLSNGNYTCLIDSAAHSSNLSNAGAFKIVTNGIADTLIVKGNGSVQIGTAASATGTTGVTIQGGTTTSAAYALATLNSAAAVTFEVRNDGRIGTGTAANSPYNLTTGSAANMFVDSGGLLYRSTSSLKYKTDVQDYTRGLDAINALRPVFYKGINDGDKQFAGLIAEEVHEAGLGEFVVYNQQNEPDALHYGNMVALAFKAIQELHAKVEALEARVAELEA
jgi:uncharacterized protein YaiE (UPF0345 family)